MFIASLLRNTAARLFPWLSGSSTAIVVAPIAKPEIAAPSKRKRPFQPNPTLWPARSQSQQKLYCGPVAVAALIGVDADEVVALIQLHRNDFRPVVRTRAAELQRVFQHYGHDLQLVADLSSQSPTLARWERERTDWEFDQALLVTVTDHWVAVRGWWFADTWTGGWPVRLSDAPRRRKRMRLVYSVGLINQSRVLRDKRTGRIIQCVE